MIKKASIKKFVLLLSAALGASCAGGVWATVSADDASSVTFSDHGIQTEYVTNAVFETPKVVAYCDGKEYETDCTIVFPDGKTTYSDIFVLDQSGEYSITYSTVIGGTTYEHTQSFVAKDSAKNLFTVEKGSISFGKTTFFEELYGAEVMAQAGTYVEYNKVIDLSSSTKNDEFIEILATANTQGTEDFTQFYITLTDIYDEENFFSVKVNSTSESTVYSSYLQAKAPGQRYGGMENGKPNFGVSVGGLVVAHSFGSAFPASEGNTSHSINLCYDSSERALYAKTGGMIKLILDFDDTQYITKPWSGFSTGEVKLSIKLGGVNGQPKFVIKSIDGTQMIAETPVDVKAPVITCDVPANIPTAIVGKKYAVFGARASDNAALSSSSTKVYYRYNSGNEVNVGVVDGCFVPHREGEYSIVYTATDLSGNVSEKIVSIQARNESEIDPLAISIASEAAETKQVGENIYVRAYECNGGVGYEKITVEVKKDGNTVQTIEKNKFNIYETGEYEIVYTATDYVGNISTVSHSLTVVANIEPLLLEEIVLPEAFIDGLSYALPQVKAHDYSNGKETLIQPVITAKLNGQDVAVTNGKITPNAQASGDKITVSYKYVNEAGQESLWEKEVPVITVKEETGAINQARYFYTEGFKVEAQTESIFMSTSQTGATATFLRPVQAKNLKLGIGYENELFNSQWIDVIISDKFEATEKVTVRIYKDNKISINGGAKQDVIGLDKTNETTIYTLNYDNQTLSFTDSLGNGLGNVKTTNNGEEFNGFTNEEVFITILTGETDGNSKLYCTMINNQPITKAGRDSIVPQIYVNELFGGPKQLGETIQIYRAQSFDVLQDIVSFTVTFRNLDTDEILKDINGLELSGVSAEQDYWVRLDAYGRYQVKYDAKDTAGKQATLTKVINVFDDQAPTITLKGKMPKKAKLKTEITVPSYTVKDGQTKDITSYLVAIAPNGEMTYFESSFTPDQRGKWTVCYFAMDANGQITTLEYVITVE